MGYGAELELYAKGNPEVRILVTSQNLPNHAPASFEVWALPPTMGDAVESLLKLYLGKERGKEVYDYIANTPLKGTVSSGYDVRLLADLFEELGVTRGLPESRLGLYEAILAKVHLPDGSAYPVDELCKAAWALWCDGERQFFPGYYISSDLLEPLRTEDRKVVRSLAGER